MAFPLQAFAWAVPSAWDVLPPLTLSLSIISTSTSSEKPSCPPPPQSKPAPLCSLLEQIVPLFTALLMIRL